MERLSCLQSIHGVEDSPYPHVFIAAALLAAIYAELEASFPEALAWSNLPPIWEEFLRFQTSAEYLQAVVRLFEPQLVRCLGPSRPQRLLTGSVKPRRMGGPSDLVTDCQFVLNDPVGGASNNQPPHVDNPKEIYAGLLYMRSPLDKAIGRQLAPSLHTPLHSFSYRRNCFVLFFYTFGAVHSVTTRRDPLLRRRSINSRSSRIRQLGRLARMG